MWAYLYEYIEREISKVGKNNFILKVSCQNINIRLSNLSISMSIEHWCADCNCDNQDEIPPEVSLWQ
jgi:hypothetical protein